MTDWQFTDAYSPDAVQRLGRGRLLENPKVVPTGFPDIDRRLWFWGASRGIPCGEYVIVGGASNAGKTQFGLWVVKQAMKAQIDAGVVSLEMRAEDIQLRLYQAMLPELDHRTWQPGRWTTERAQALEAAAAKVREPDGRVVTRKAVPGLSAIQRRPYILLDSLEADDDT